MRDPFAPPPHARGFDQPPPGVQPGRGPWPLPTTDTLSGDELATLLVFLLGAFFFPMGGLVAAIYWHRARNAATRGNADEARTHLRTTRTISLASLAIGIVAGIAILALLFAMR